MKKIATISSLFLAVTLVCVSGRAHAETILPDFSAATFVPGAPINNPYFPLTGGGTRLFQGREEPGGPIVEFFTLTNLGTGPTILGVQTSTQLDRAYEDNLLVEETFDYFAQDSAGNVWYFGEDVTNYVYDDAGNLIETNNASSWRARVNGALPGFIMPADLTVGFNYYQEFAPLDAAIDQGITFAVGKQVTIGIGDFTNVLQVLEINPLEPDSREFKYYAPGRGLILAEEGLDANFQNPELRAELARPVPEPTTILLLGTGLAGLGRVIKKRRRGPHS